MGITTRAIPRIERISDALARVGWQAACVDGFIPPAVFKAFQARGLLPIAGDVRPPTQVGYTPAPDIIHEAVGHAPLLVVRQYADYLRAIGQEGRRAFGSATAHRADEAVRRLSKLKLDPLVTRQELDSAECAVLEAQAKSTDSEAERLSRLYWWTAEYGLLGTLSDYSIIGAGLLSSLAESHFCHGSGVERRVLSADCTQQGFDISHAQPQLYVARSFDHLHEVLESVARQLAYRAGGVAALRAALRSAQLCTVELSCGTRISGVLAADSPGSGDWLRFEPGARLLLEDAPPQQVSGPLFVPLGPLANGAPASSLGAQPQEREGLRVRYASGLEVRGRTSPRLRPGRSVIGLASGEVWRGERRLLRSSTPWPLLLCGQLVTAEAGCDDWQPGVPFGSDRTQTRESGERLVPAGPQKPSKNAPAPSASRLGERRARALYRRARQLPRGSAVPAASLYASIRAERSQDWLLLWTLLERLHTLGRGPRRTRTRKREPSHERLRQTLVAQLRSDLERLELAAGGREPIGSALASLGRPGQTQ